MALNIQIQNKGFGSYLTGMIPDDIAVGCGAFAATMLQVKNIRQIPTEKFAQIAQNIETAKGLNINGTSVPVDTGLAKTGLGAIAKGNGPFMSYTMSNFIGAMSGVPYNAELKKTQDLITSLQTDELKRIYRENYLAVTWQQSTVSVQFNTYQVASVTYYHVTGLSISNAGGGYGREGGPAPTINISNGGSGTTTIGVDDTDLTTFGRVKSVTLTSSGTDGTSVPTATVTSPPGPGWPGMNTVVQNYINLANAEILRIQSSNPSASAELNKSYNTIGSELFYEQRARSIGLPHVPPQYPDEQVQPNYSSSPTTYFSFIDALYTYGKSTQPHMYAQSLEGIANLSTAGGQSIVGLMRESRNQSRLTEVGVPLDNTIPDKLSRPEQTVLFTTGSLPLTDDKVTPPATLLNIDSSGNLIGSVPVDLSDINGPVIPGALSTNPWANIVSPNLNSTNSSKTLLSSTYNVGDAIAEVIRCNCDCWDNL